MATQLNMFSFIKKRDGSNLQPPPTIKKSKTKQEILDQQKIYEREDRSRSFQKDWLKLYTWLVPSSDDVRDGTSTATDTDSVSKMFCRVCRPYKQTGAFVVGCSVFKKASIVAHEKSKSHQLNI